MRAGQLDREITIERATTSIGDAGTPSETWAALANVRAQVIEATTDEARRAQGASTEALVIFRIRYLDGLSVADRVQYAGQTFNLKSVKELGRRRALELRAERLGP